mgnify:CR=1 FL=1
MQRTSHHVTYERDIMSKGKQKDIVANVNAVYELPADVAAKVMQHCASTDQFNTDRMDTAIALHDAGILVAHLVMPTDKKPNDAFDAAKLGAVHRTLCRYIASKGEAEDKEKAALAMMQLLSTSASSTQKELKSARANLITRIGGLFSPLVAAMRRYEKSLEAPAAGAARDKARAWALKYLSEGRTKMATAGTAFFDIDAGDVMDIFDKAKQEVRHLDSIE